MRWPRTSRVICTQIRKTYNSVPISLKELDIIRADITSILGDLLCNIEISMTTISKFVRKIKSGKRNGGHGLGLDHLINGSNKVFHVMHFLFNAMIVHGYTANELLHTTIISISTNLHSSLCSSDMLLIM